ncbi:MAG: hydrogenase 4 subunit F [Candidatus Rokuibacteriota bacterium]
MSTFALLLGPPLLGSLLAVVVRPYRRFVGWANALLSLVSLGAAVALWSHILAGDVLISDPGEFLRADALSTLLALCVSVVGALAAWLGPGMGEDDGYDPAQARRFRIFGNLFTFTMLFAVTSNNVGFMWIAIEATTITSALLIPLHVTKASVEASWKYILIGSIGIALAFGGTVLGYFDFVSLAGRQPAALNWTVLMAVAPQLHPEVIQLAFVFILIGYGTKAGLAPMHTWLPDAHSEAPAPLSAMMSGVLLAVALYAVIRWEAVVNAAVGTKFTDDLFIALGVLSLAIAAFSLVIQRNYKRMLAYSSIEHTGLMCVGLALGPLGTFAAMLHLLNHTLAKSTMFFLAGRVLHRYRTTEISGVSGLLKTMPWTGGLFAAGVLAVVGLPPFGLFISEFALFRAGFAAGRPWLMGLVLALLAVAFVSMIGHLNRMLYGAPSAGVPGGEPGWWPLVPLGACVAALVVLGVTLPAPVDTLLRRIVEIVGR